MNSLRKLLQKKSLDLLTTKYGLLGVFISITLLATSIFMFGEAIVDWSGEKYATIFNSFSDNLLGKSFRSRLCLPVPIDVVYTWVNGTDPKLLSELRQVKGRLLAETSFNSSQDHRKGSGVCHYANCIKAPILVLNLPLPPNITRDDLQNAVPQFSTIFRIDTVTTDDLLANITLLHLLNKRDADDLRNTNFTLNDITYTAFQGFYTSDITIPQSRTMTTLTLVSGFKKPYTADEIKQLIPKHLSSLIFNIDVEGGVALIKTATSAESDKLRQSAYNFTLDNRYLQFNMANLIYDLNRMSSPEVLTTSRFEDNEELRYSLRSLEQYAPWVRHVYIVTNGQIPYWLDLENPRVTLITHEEIFINKSHLPTFSSPAIETHLHRIPGLSERFLYLNDDVMFGAQAWPDDFYTHSSGQKVYLAWSIPDCAPGCPQSWINDGYCDRACNVSACGFDDNDCKGGARVFEGAGDWGNNQWNRESEQSVCSVGCADQWIADQYCDQSCNLLQCGFDAGDCGTDNYNQLYGINLSPRTTEYTVPRGQQYIYMNYTMIHPEDTIESSQYSDLKVVRSAGVSLKLKIITLVLKENYNQSVLNIKLEFKLSNTFNLTLVVDTRPSDGPENIHFTFKPTQPLPDIDNNTNKSRENITKVKPEPTPQHLPEVPVIPEELKNPKLVTAQQKSDIETADFSELMKELQRKLADDELTLKGFEKRKEALRLMGQNATGNQTWKTRDLLSINDNLQPGFLPWERKDKEIYKLSLQKRSMDSYKTERRKSRRLLDTFAQSLHHVNDLYTQMFGHKNRKVPAHVPHLIDKTIMTELYNTFREQWDKTSSNKMRSADDMQYAFSYYYFLMDSQHNSTELDFFKSIDIDSSGVLSDRELRTMATRIYDSPLDFQSLVSMERHIINCSRYVENYNEDQLTPLQQEKYYTPGMPQVTLSLLAQCQPIIEQVKNKVPRKSKYKFEELGDEHSTFKMIGTNVSTVVGQLDSIRRHPKKFICLNDNIDHTRPDAMQVKALLADFYESIFPIRSQFELAADYRNRFLHIDELREWKRYRDNFMVALEILLALLICYTIYSFYEEQIYKWWYRGRRPTTTETV